MRRGRLCFVLLFVVACRGSDSSPEKVTRPARIPTAAPGGQPALPQSSDVKSLTNGSRAPVRSIEAKLGADHAKTNLPVDACRTRVDRSSRRVVGPLPASQATHAAISPTEFLATYKSIVDGSVSEHVVGDVWRITLDSNSCDVRIEMADAHAGTEAPRVLVTIPHDDAHVAIRHAIDRVVADATGGQHVSIAPLALQTPIWMGFIGLVSHQEATGHEQSGVASPVGLAAVATAQLECRIGGIPLATCDDPAPMDDVPKHLRPPSHDVRSEGGGR